MSTVYAVYPVDCRHFTPLAAGNPELFQRVADALDSQCRAALPFEVHVVHAAQKVLHVRSTRAASVAPVECTC